jgi:hypothetical protein
MDGWTVGSGPYSPDTPSPLLTGPLYPNYDLGEPCRFAKVPDGPQVYILNIVWLQKGGAYL